MSLEPMMEVVMGCLLVEFVRLFVSQQSVVAVSPLGKFEALELTATKRLGIIIKKNIYCLSPNHG